MRRVGWPAVALAAWLVPAGGVARPAGRAPGSGGPPAAWVETRAGDRWLAFSSFCWSGPGAGGAATGRCVDYVAPQRRRDLPTIVLRTGELARFHLGFRPRSVSLNIG